MKQLLRITILLIGLIWILAWAAAGRFDDTPNTQDGSESPLPSGEITAPGERDSAKTLRVQIQGEVQEMDMAAASMNFASESTTVSLLTRTR